ncbi:MAG: hypothetical protein IPK16_11240 [Anaerolineales bacterium]|nr:hypothetical protein [Anaerolineales bacterium]
MKSIASRSTWSSRLLLATGLALVALSLSVISAQAATYYVSPTGKDTANGTSTSTPWATFDRAWQTVAPGDTLILMDGTYYEALNPDTQRLAWPTDHNPRPT